MGGAVQGRGGRMSRRDDRHVLVQWPVEQVRYSADEQTVHHQGGSEGGKL